MRPARRPFKRGGIRGGHGFTLIETALATVILGVGVLAMIESQEAFMRANNWSSHAATAAYLADEVRELSRTLPKHDPVTGLSFTGEGALVGWGPEAGELGVDDFDDLDDFDGLSSAGITFWPNATGTLADDDQLGPIDAAGGVIPDIAADGSVRTDGNGAPLALQGWSQTVMVEKLDPFDHAVVVSDSATVAAVPPNYDGLAVDRFPLRVTVIVRYQGPFDNQPAEVSRVVWIVP